MFEVGVWANKGVIVSMILIGIGYSRAEMLYVCLEFRRSSPLLHMWNSKLRMSPSSRNLWTLTGLQGKVQQVTTEMNPTHLIQNLSEDHHKNLSALV